MKKIDRILDIIIIISGILLIPFGIYGALHTIFLWIFVPTNVYDVILLCAYSILLILVISVIIQAVRKKKGYRD